MQSFVDLTSVPLSVVPFTEFDNAAIDVPSGNPHETLMGPVSAVK